MPEELRAPLAGNLRAIRVNRTLHGRSVYRPVDAPGHNVFRGYTRWRAAVARRPGWAWGDAADLFRPGGTPVYALEACTQTLHQGDASRKEVIYLRGARCLAVYAHINAKMEGVGHEFAAGQVVGWVRKDLCAPHLHLEIALFDEGFERPVSARTPEEWRAKLCVLCGQPPG